MKITNQKIALAFMLPSIVVLLVGAILSNDHDAAEKEAPSTVVTKTLTKESSPTVQSATLLDNDKQPSRMFNIEDSTANNNHFTGAQDLSVVSETEKIPVENMSADDIRTDTASIHQTVMPVVVGSELLAREAMGIRKMNKAVLRKWRLERVLPR